MFCILAAAIIFAANASTSIDQPACLLGLSALFCTYYLVLVLALVEVDYLPTDTALAVYLIQISMVSSQSTLSCVYTCDGPRRC